MHRSSSSLWNVSLGFCSITKKIEHVCCAYLSSYHEEAIKALYELAEELPAFCLPHQDAGIEVLFSATQQ